MEEQQKENALVPYYKERMEKRKHILISLYWIDSLKIQKYIAKFFVLHYQMRLYNSTLILTNYI